MLNKHDHRYKEYLRLQKKMDEVWEKLRQVPWVPVGEPYKDGWFIFYDLRKDISVRKDAQVIREAIKAGYHTSFTRQVLHVKAVRAGKKTVKGRKGKIVDLSPGRKRLTPIQYEALSPAVKKYFELDTDSIQYKKWSIKEYRIQMPAYWLTLRAKARIVTHIQKKGGELESEYEFLRDKYYSYFDLGINYSKSYPRGKDRRQVRDSIQKFKNGDIDDIQIKDLPLIYEY